MAETEPFILIEGLFYCYQKDSEPGVSNRPYALNGIDLEIHRGEYLAVIGANGSGKTSLLRHLNALLIPTRGDVWIGKWNTRDTSQIRNIRSTVGMVFQVPESQIVATVVEEDVAFGPENLGVPRDELRRRIDWALHEVGLYEHRNRPSHLLSAGQKQLLAIASSLVMLPACLLLDEATSMIDPASRERFFQTVRRLHEKGMTIIAATHTMEEAIGAQRVVLLSEGSIVIQGPPREVFTQFEKLQRLRMMPPAPVRIARKVARSVAGFPADTLTVQELVDAVIDYRKRARTTIP